MPPKKHKLPSTPRQRLVKLKASEKISSQRRTSRGILFTISRKKRSKK